MDPVTENGLSYVGYSLDDGTTWQSLAAYSSNFRQTGGELKTGEWVHFETDYPILTPGKFNAVQLQFRFVYTHGTSEPYALLRSEFVAKSQVTMRWSYSAATADYFKAKGYLVNVPVPDADAASADPLAVEIVMRAPKIEPVLGS